MTFYDLVTIIETQTKTRISSYMHDQKGLEIIWHEKRFICDFTDQLPFGRNRTLKYRSTWSKDLLRFMIIKPKQYF